jgi:DNA-binding NtrC family response regulator
VTETGKGVDDRSTRALGSDSGGLGSVRSFHIIVEEGPQKGERWHSRIDRCSIGSHLSNDLSIDDPTVSRFHCEIALGPRGAVIRDLDSRNGTSVDGVRVTEGFLRGDSRIRLGKSVVRFQYGNEVHHLPVSERQAFGSLVGVSLAMRTAFAVLERAAATDVTVLIDGETGTGKEGAARVVHDGSARKGKPFVVVDCGAIPANLLESELFGHERGAFTGATGQRIGAFEEADSGTIFLDELGELPLELQPKLLRALESREIRRIGSNTYQSIDVRVVAATNRDLRAAVNDGRFRPDLYFRLAVVRVSLPPLRERPEDIPVLVEHIVDQLTDDAELRAPLLAKEFVTRLQRAAWIGNVRELRNYLERCLVLGGPVPFGEPALNTKARPSGVVDAGAPYADARQRALDEFEHAYLEALLARHDGKVAPAARAAGMNRAYMYRLLQRHGLRGG